MIGELEQRQIVSLLRQGMEDEAIAKAMELDVSVVKLIAAKNGADRDIDDDQLAFLRKHAFALAVGAAEENVQARMTMFLLERDKPSKVERSESPIALINNAIIAANGAFDKLVKEMSG